MVYPAHYLLQFGGPRGEASEELWTCGIRMVPVGGNLNLSDTQDYLDDVCYPALEGWFFRDDSRIASIAKLSFAKLNRIGPDGLYAETTTIAHYGNPPLAGKIPTAGAAVMYQAALVYTWETDAVNRGLASRGRIYSPAPVVTLNTQTGLFDTNVANAIAVSAAQLIEDLRGDGNAGAMTPNIISNQGAGVAHRIDRVSVDNRVDIIRKRANGMTPVRRTAVVAA